MENNVLSYKHLCAGCGICAGICPHITMAEDDLGLLFPKVDSSCVGCGKCIKACPMLISKSDRLLIQQEAFEENGCLYKHETGYYLKCYEGYVVKNRNQCASGGLCSALLAELLDKNIVDMIYCAGTTGSHEALFTYQAIYSSDEVLSHARSAYYPISIDEVIKQIRQSESKVAIVCLPCQATAVRALMKSDRILRRNIKYIIGLVCGGVPGKGMIEYIAEKKSINMQDVSRVSFREKDEGIRCNNCQIKLYNHNEVLLGVSRYHGEEFGFVYFNKIFHYKACLCCDDIFAESADVVFGDGWFDEYKTNEYGTSICIVRNKEIDLCIKCISEKADIHETNIDRMVLAQSNVYLIQQKKGSSGIYKKLYALEGYHLPNDFGEQYPWKQVVKIWLTKKCGKELKRQWIRYKKKQISFVTADKRLHRIISIEKRMHL